MNYPEFLLAAFCTLFSASTSAQTQHVSSEDEFAGRWKVLPFPITQQPPESRADPFIKGECVYMLHERDGKWIALTINRAPGAPTGAQDCSHSFKELDAHKAAAGASSLQWKKRERVFIVSDEKTGVGYMWSALVIDADGFATFVDPAGPRVEMKKGDLLMQLAQPSGRGIAWRMVLRRVPE